MNFQIKVYHGGKRTVKDWGKKSKRLGGFFKTVFYARALVIVFMCSRETIDSHALSKYC